MGARPAAADVGCEGVPEPAADVRRDHRERLPRIVHRPRPGRPDVRVPEGSRRPAVRRPLRLSRAVRRPAGVHAVGPDRGRAAGFRPELGGGLLLLDRLRLAGPPADRPEPGFPRDADLGALRRVRRADHAVRPGDVGLHLLGRVHRRHLVPDHLAGAVLHVVRHAGSWRPGPSSSRCRWPGGSDGSGRRFPDTSGSARSGAASGSGARARQGHGRREPRARRRADPRLRVRALHPPAARDGRRHGDRGPAERGRRRGEAGDPAPSGSVHELPPATRRPSRPVAIADGRPAP